MTASLAERVLAGDPRAVARAISLVEDDDPQGPEVIRAIYPHTGRSYIIGVTGPPGAGKSTLVDRLVTEIRTNRGGRAVLATREGRGSQETNTVGVIAVDPTSPFTGGAVLGDRLRMQRHAADAGVFVRSMATRGHLGGLSRATADTAIILDASGHDIVIIETVGVGQDEVDIVRAADVVVVTLVPGAGDDVQALKAGIMEIADVFVVNKADRDGAERLAAAIDSTLGLKTFDGDEWRPPILKTTATSGAGVPELLDAIVRFAAHTAARQLARRCERSEVRLKELVSRRFLSHLQHDVISPQEWSALAAQVASREVDPYTAADQLFRRAV